jgi:hypothetical protein
MDEAEDQTTTVDVEDEKMIEEPTPEPSVLKKLEDTKEECKEKIGRIFLDKLALVLSKGKVTINLILFTLLGIIISPFIDAMRELISVGVADFIPFFDVVKYIAAPFVMLIATKRIMDDLANKGEDTKNDLAECKKALSDSERGRYDDNQSALLREEQMKSRYELEIQQYKGIMDIKNHEIGTLNDTINRLETKIHLLEGKKQET